MRLKFQYGEEAHSSLDCMQLWLVIISTKAQTWARVKYNLDKDSKGGETGPNMDKISWTYTINLWCIIMQ
jgi:hypothetical protein